MKTRSGFVSNSSSTSFLVALKNQDCEHCGRKKVDFAKLKIADSSYGDGEVSIVAHSINDVEKCLKDMFGEDYGEDYPEQKNAIAVITEQVKEAIHEGYREMIEVSVPYGDSSMEMLQGLLEVKTIYTFD